MATAFQTVSRFGPESGTDVPARIVQRIPPIPESKGMHGPLTARRLWRFYAILAAVFLVGLTPILLGASPAWKAFGLGLMFPGAGFLYSGGVLGVVFAVGSLALFLVILFLWWARGVLLAPPLVLVATAGLSAAWIGGQPGISGGDWAIPAAVLAFHGLLAVRRRQKYNAARERGRSLNEIITRAEPILRDYPVAADPEMGASQIVEFRRMLDLALQPVDSWEGFSTDDTWQDGALRYQICTMSWNLALGQYTRLPAFHGYLNSAQENLIRKHIDRKTWNYWYWESLWGNLQIEKNPVTIDNIMLSGFLGVSLGLFETASGTSPFAKPGSLTFRWDENLAFPYSHATMLEEVVKNFERYDIGWFPCEPRWIYSMCNLVGRTALELHDARHGTQYAARIRERFEQTMNDEMLLPDGRIKVCLSSPFGFQVPSLSGLFGETWGIRFMTPHAPEQAERLWQVLRQDYIKPTADGGLDFKLLPLGWDTRKPADFSRWAELNPLMLTYWAALEMGDEQIVAATAAEMDRRYGDGVAASMTWSGRNTVRNMVNKGLPEAWAKGPILADAAYPAVIVARAVTDGVGLELVLHPGADAGPQRIGLERLVPGRSYRVVETDARLVADSTGKASLDVVLNGRTSLHIVPVE